MRRLLVAALLAAGGAGGATADGLRIQPGMWTSETTVKTTVQMQGKSMPMAPQTQNSEQCISAEDATLDPSEVAMEGCEVSNMESGENSISFEMACSQGGTTMGGQMKLSKNAAGTETSGSFSLNGSQTEKGTSVSVSGTLSSKRIGDC